MAGRIVLFGATGYTGELTARALARRGAAPLLAARDAERVGALAAELGLEHAVADAGRPESLRRLLQRGDVLISTVGPFLRFGETAVQAAVAQGAHYLDSTGEGPFIRRVFERHGPAAQTAGCGLLTAFGYDFVPGNLAGALALREAGPHAVGVDVGYFVTGSAASGAISGGTQASAPGMLLEPTFSWRGGRVVTERGARRRRTFPVRGKPRQAVSLGGSEALALPRLQPLRDVQVYLGWFGSASPALQALSAPTSVITKVPGVRGALGAAAGRLVRGSTGGPDAETRAKTGSYAVAEARDAAGQVLAEVHVSGANAYDFTADILAWGAVRAAEGALRGTGALGPADGYGLDELEVGCAEAGLTRTPA